MLIKISKNRGEAIDSLDIIMNNIISNINLGVKARSFLQNLCAFSTLILLIEPKSPYKASIDPTWTLDMQ